MIVAGRVLEGWKKAPAKAPFPVDRPSAVRAFLHGAMAPDMGFMPGVDRLVSEAAHYLTPGDLTRRLLAGARTLDEEAFAWGWANHVLVDVEVHPVVGRAVGERLYGDRHRRVDALHDVTTHVSLEVGLDVALLRTEEGVPPPPSAPLFDRPAAVEHLEASLADTYGHAWMPEELLRAHRRAVTLTRWWPKALGLLALRPPGPPGSSVSRGSSGPPGSATWGGTPGPRGLGPVAPAVSRPPDASPFRRPVFRVLAGLAGGDGAARGFFLPEAPRRWFLDEVRARMRVCVETFQDWVDDGLAGLENPNLETGVESGVGRGHPATELAHRRLAEIRGSF